jgi:hydrogenase nickel incorporation protein HypA/HybF
LAINRLIGEQVNWLTNLIGQSDNRIIGQFKIPEKNMHEGSIAQNLLTIALEKAKEYKANEITLIRVKVGEFTGVNQAALEFAFDNFSQGTIAEKASLKIISSPLLGKCRKCNKTFEIKKDNFRCSKCHSPEIDIISGEDLYIEDIEIE